MAYYVISSSNSIHNTADDPLSANGLQLGAGESALITADGYILATGAAGTGVYINGYAEGSRLTVNGYVYGTRDGIYSLGHYAEITVNGIVEGDGNGASVSGGSLYISPTGRISGGVSLQDTEFVNDGTLYSGFASTAVQISSGSVVNNGLISSTAFGFFYDADDHVRITNTGTIEGDFETYYNATAATSEVDITNSGDWIGDIGLSPGNDSVTNTGRLIGDVFLGDGTNSMDSRYGFVSGGVSGGSGADTILLGAGDTIIQPGAGADTVDGGAGVDTLNYSTSAKGVSVNLATGAAAGGDARGDHFSNIENLGGTLYNDVLVGDAGANVLNGILGRDTITGAGGNDTIVMYGRGPTTVDSGTGNDLIQFLSLDHATYGYAFSATDQIQGGTGYDTLEIKDAAALTFTATTVRGIEHMLLDDGFDYNFTSADATVASGARMLVDGSLLTAGNTLHFDASHETNGGYDFIGGDARDVFIGGALGDTFAGGAAADTLTGKGGADTFIFDSVADSQFTAMDRITDFNAAADHLQFDFAVSAVEAPVSGSASTSADLHALVNGHMGVGDAILVNVTGGSLVGSTLLLVDANGTAGFQGAGDFCIDVTGMTGTLDVGDFVM
jgi:hypothetical protein